MRATLAAFAAGLLLALAIWALWPAPAPIVETAAPEVRQDDGSVILERQPTTPDATPAQAVPKGAKVERVVQVKVQPHRPAPLPAGDGLKPAGPLIDIPPCPPVTVDMTLLREPDGSRRVVASSPDGRIVGGVDIPVETPPPPAARRWAAGLSLDPIHQTPGVWLERDLMRLRVGVEINQIATRNAGREGEIRLRVGIVF
jgi:hypothetical protein